MGAFSLSFFLTPLFFIRFKSQELKTFDLGFNNSKRLHVKDVDEISLYRLYTIAIMSGIGIVELYEAIKPRLNGKKALATGIITLVILPGVIAGLSFKEVCSLHPEMNEAWENFKMVEE